MCVCVVQPSGKKRCCLLFHWTRGQNDSWGWGRRRCVQSQAPTDPPQSDCDLVQNRNLHIIKSSCLFQYLSSSSSAFLLLRKKHLFIYSKCQYWVSVVFPRATSERTREVKQPGELKFSHSRINTGGLQAGMRLMFKIWGMRNTTTECPEQI